MRLRFEVPGHGSRLLFWRLIRLDALVILVPEAVFPQALYRVLMILNCLPLHTLSLLVLVLHLPPSGLLLSLHFGAIQAQVAIRFEALA